MRVLSGAALAFADRLLEGVDRALVWDVHVHLVGLGTGGTGCWVHPHMRSHLHPLRHLQFDAYAAAAGIDPGDEEADGKYLSRLLALHRAGNPTGKLVLLAFDWNHTEAGEPAPEASTFHVPNDYVLRTAREHDDVVACASIHPYRRDALDELDRVAEEGARALKWLPNAMGIDPALSRCDAFYDRLRELDLPLLVHTGREQAVDSNEAQELGNPLRVRRALEHGVRVIAAHCAGTGEYSDPDRPGSAPRPAFDLFLELMDDPRYADLLFGDLSAMTQVNRCGEPLATVLARDDLHSRLLFGSDYPLPAIRAVVSTRVLKSKGYIDAEERRLLNEVFAANPLLFDLLVKRALRVDVDGERRGFSASAFETGRFFGGA